jgi:Rrf2 family protein
LLALTRKTDYALVALSELARHAPQTLCARKLAQLTSIPLPVLSGVLNQLVHHGLVVSLRGVQGGYRLARPADAISLVDVVHAIDGVPRLTQCCSGTHAHDVNEPCKLEPRCRITGPMQRVHQGLLEFMGRIFLAHIAFDMVPMNVESRTKAS